MAARLVLGRVAPAGHDAPVRAGADRRRIETSPKARARRQDLTASQRAALRRLEADLEDSAGRFAAEEIALALNMSVTSVDKQLRLAQDLHSVHRDLGEALELGQVSGFVAAMVAQATRKLPDETRRLLDPAVTSDAIEQPAGRAIDAARARTAEMDVDADAAARRAARARSVFLKPMDDAMAMLGAVMPADEAVRAYRRLDEAARRHRSNGDERNLDQLRCDELSALLTGVGVGSPVGRWRRPNAAVGARALRTTAVQVVISLTTLLGLDSKSAHLDGYGTVSAGAARDMVASGDFTLSRLLCNPDTGAVIHTDPTVYVPSDGLRHAVACRDRHCRMPVCGARIRHLDHIEAWADAGLTTADNLHGLCLRSHLAKHHPGWRVRGKADDTVTWTTPTGHEYSSQPRRRPATGPARRGIRSHRAMFLAGSAVTSATSWPCGPGPSGAELPSRRSLAADTRASKSRPSEPVSGCHCTPMWNLESGDSIASTTPSELQAATSYDGWVATPWWW